MTPCRSSVAPLTRSARGSCFFRCPAPMYGPHLLIRIVAFLSVATHIGAASVQAASHDRSPVDVVLLSGDRWMVSANQTSGTVSLIDVKKGHVVDEVAVGNYPVALEVGRDGREVWVSCRDSGTVAKLVLRSGRLEIVQQVQLGYHPWDMAWDASRQSLWVAQRAAGRIVELDGETGKSLRHVSVGSWPERLAIAPRGNQLAVTLAGAQGIALVDLTTGNVERRSFRALNQGQPLFTPDGAEVWLPWMVYRANPITEANIRRGWVWGSRLGRIPLDPSVPRRVLTLDERGRAVADVADMAWVGPASGELVVTAAGTHELLWFGHRSSRRSTPGPSSDPSKTGSGANLLRKRLPWREYAATDHMDARLIPDISRFRRIPLGGRPLGVAVTPSGDRAFVANYLKNSVQVVDLKTFQVATEISVGGPESPSLARRGAAIFFDAGRSLDQWYSCHTCHLDGGTNAIVTDTLNDGTPRTFKTILSLYDLPHTGPWTWHGWQTDLRAAMHKSLTSTMLGKAPTDQEVAALLAFFSELPRPVNPYAVDPSRDRSAIERGRKLFHEGRAGCADCHSGPYLTDGQVHDVGTGSESDRYDGYNTPSLRGVTLRLRYLHDGRARSLESLLREHHRPEDVAGVRPLDERQLRDLVEYLRTL